MAKRTKTDKQLPIAQGDVLLLPMGWPTTLPITPEHKKVAADEHGRLVLAEGESSGHRHLFREIGVCLLRREGVSDQVITLIDPAALLHDQGAGEYVPTGDHDPIDVPAGTRVVRVQREWTGEGVRNAAD